MKPTKFQGAQHGCPKCGRCPTMGEDFHSGVYMRAGRLVRLHAPRYRLRCLSDECGHTELVPDHSKQDDIWMSAFQPA